MTIEQLQHTVDVWINTTGVRYFNELTNTAVSVYFFVVDKNNL